MEEKIKCPHCGEETSAAYTHCEKCNMPLKKGSSGAGVFKILTFILIALSIHLTIIMWNDIGSSALIYLLSGLITAALMYGIGRIIDLLYQIKCNTDKK